MQLIGLKKMKLTNLEPAYDLEVQKWLYETIDLTPYQKEKIRDNEIIRFAPFKFYKWRKKEKILFLWRLTIFLVPFYLLILYMILPYRMIFTGEWGYGQKFIDNFHNKWLHKLNL